MYQIKSIKTSRNIPGQELIPARKEIPKINQDHGTETLHPKLYYDCLIGATHGIGRVVR